MSLGAQGRMQGLKALYSNLEKQIIGLQDDHKLLSHQYEVMHNEKEIRLKLFALAELKASKSFCRHMPFPEYLLEQALA